MNSSGADYRDEDSSGEQNSLISSLHHASKNKKKVVIILTQLHTWHNTRAFVSRKSYISIGTLKKTLHLYAHLVQWAEKVPFNYVRFKLIVF